MSEIGVFFKSVITIEREEKAEFLSNSWMGSNLEYKGLKEVLKSYNPSSETKKPSSKEINNDWKRLAKFNQR